MEQFAAAGRSEPASLRARVNDIQEKSAQLDRFLERRTREKQERPPASDARSAREEDARPEPARARRPEPESRQRARERDALDEASLRSSRSKQLSELNLGEMRVSDEAARAPRPAEGVLFDNPQLKSRLGEPLSNNYLAGGGSPSAAEERRAVPRTQGHDLSIDSAALEEFDYVEAVEPGE